MEITINEHGCGELYVKIFNAIAGSDLESKTFIDLCCAEATISRHFQFKEKTYVDVLDEWNIPGQMDRYVQADVLGQHAVFDKHYDVALCSDGIEHLIKSDGLRLIERMKTISDRQILFTPLGDLWTTKDNDDPKSHKSGWFPADFKGFAAVVCPIYHPTFNHGAFFVWRCPDMEMDFERVKATLASSIAK